MIRPLVCLLAAGLLSACASESPPPSRFPDIRFNETPPIRLDVSSIDVTAQFKPTFQLPEVEQDFPVPPQRAIENWVHDQIKDGAQQKQALSRASSFFTTVVFENSAEVTYRPRDPEAWPGDAPIGSVTASRVALCSQVHHLPVASATTSTTARSASGS